MTARFAEAQAVQTIAYTALDANFAKTSVNIANMNYRLSLHLAVPPAAPVDPSWNVAIGRKAPHFAEQTSIVPDLITAGARIPSVYYHSESEDEAHDECLLNIMNNVLDSEAWLAKLLAHDADAARPKQEDVQLVTIANVPGTRTHKLASEDTNDDSVAIDEPDANTIFYVDGSRETANIADNDLQL